MNKYKVTVTQTYPSKRLIQWQIVTEEVLERTLSELKQQYDEYYVVEYELMRG